METYTAFDDRIAAVCKDFQNFLANAKAEGKTVAAYGAAAKGNTFLNVCGLSPSEIAFAVDRNDLKQGKLLPGTHIPVHAPTVIEDAKPDYLVILPWNLKTEIVADNEAIRDWGGRFVVAIPKLSVF